MGDAADAEEPDVGASEADDVIFEAVSEDDLPETVPDCPGFHRGDHRKAGFLQ